MSDLNATDAEMDARKIIIFTDEASPRDPGRDFDLLGETHGGTPTVGALRESIRDFMPALGSIIEEVKADAHAARLTEISVSLGIDATGKVGFLGVGSGPGGAATLSLKFRID